LAEKCRIFAELKQAVLHELPALAIYSGIFRTKRTWIKV